MPREPPAQRKSTPEAPSLPHRNGLPADFGSPQEALRVLYIPYMRLLLSGVGEPLRWRFVSNEWRAAMRMYAGLDIGGKRTAICVIDGSGKAVWRGNVDTHPEMIDGPLQRFKGSLDKVGLESRHQKPRDQERQGRHLGAGRDVADRLVFPRSTSSRSTPIVSGL